MSPVQNLRAPRAALASLTAALCFAVGCGEVSKAGESGNAGGPNGASGSPSGKGGQSATGGGGGNTTAGALTGGEASSTGDAGAGLGGSGLGGSAGADACALSTGDAAASNSDASGPVGLPPSGYLVYLAETTNLGKQVFHVRFHDGVVEPAVRLTPDAGVDGFLVSQQRPATITVKTQDDSSKLLTLVDFDASGPTGSLSLSALTQGDSGGFYHYGLDSDGSMLFASRRSAADVLFFDLRPSTPPAPLQLSGHSLSSTYGWSGSRLLFSGTAAGMTEKEVFAADPSTSPPTSTLLTADATTAGPLGFSVAPNQERAIYRGESSSGATDWYLLDLTAAVPAPLKLTAAELTTPVALPISAWSADSRYYVVQVDPGGLVLVDVEAPSRAQVVSAEGATKFTFASFSPDSQRLVYVASHGGAETTQLYGVALGPGGPSAAYPLVRGTEEEQTAYVNAPQLFGWLHGSRYVYYLGQNPHAYYLADAYGCSGRRVPIRSETNEALILSRMLPAPNARRAAFFSEYWSPGTSDVYVADVDDDGNWGAPTRISEPGGGSGAQELRFLDSDWLMFYEEDAAKRASMYLAPRDGSTPARLLSDPNDDILFTHWVPDKP